MKYSNFSLLLFAVLLLAGCGDNRLNTAHSQYLRGQYAAAIESYDHYIEISQNGAKSTRAELERGECYYQLGLRARDRELWDLAARLFYLANSSQADQQLDNCYYQLAQAAFAKADYGKVYEYYGKIADYLPDSELLPEILYNRISMAMQIEHDDAKAWDAYRLLYDRFPESDFVKRAQPFIDSFMPKYIDRAIALTIDFGYEKALESLFQLEHYPSSYHETIYLQISELYVSLAEQNVSNQDYINADKNFRAAIEYDPQKEALVRRRLNEICSLYVVKGNQLLTERKIDEAIANFRLTFSIIPNYTPGQDGIDRAETLRGNIQMALNLVEQASAAEKQKKYSLALDLYKQAAGYDRLENTQKKIFEMTNQIMIEKDPVAFARQVFREYKGGAILRRVQSLVDKNTLAYGNDVQASEWRFMLSVGEAKYEARYDITTPDKSYFLVWLINLKDRTVTPLNKASEELSQ